MEEILYRVTSPHYVAGFVAGRNGIVIKAAPIIKWMIGMEVNRIRLPNYQYKIERNQNDP